MRTKNIVLYQKILKMIAKGMKQTDIVSELSCSYTTIMSAKKWAENEAKKESKDKKTDKNAYEYAVKMVLNNRFFPVVWKKAIKKYVVEGSKK